MPGTFFVAEEYRRLLCGFTAEIESDRGRKAAEGPDAKYDPLRLRPIADVTSGIEYLLNAPTDIPIEWRFGEYMAANTVDLLTVRAISSTDIGEALDVLHQNQSVQTNVRTISHRSRGGGELAAIHHGEGANSHIPRFIFQSIVAAKIALLFKLYTGSTRQHQIDMQTGCLGSLMQRLDRDLDFIDLDFRDGEISLGFSRDMLVHRLPEPDDRLKMSLDHELRRRIAEAPPAGGRLKDRIKFHIRSKHLAEVSLDEICDTFRVQRRTLGRLLRDEGTTFTSILTELRREKALHLVRNSGVPLKRVAAELGFNSDASFNMAFKRWTGTTPMAFRKAAPARPPAHPQPVELALAVEPKRSLRPGMLLSSWSHRSA